LILRHLKKNTKLIQFETVSNDRLTQKLPKGVTTLWQFFFASVQKFSDVFTI